MAARRSNSAAKRGSFRIIAGRWRGRRLSFVDDGSVRPTPDRIRETLFNWLADDLHEARCLDLYAGSGALGLEALSRGAGAITFIDAQRGVLDTLREHLDLLAAEADCRQQRAEDFLRSNRQRFDIAFVDPPYGQGLVTATLTGLAPHMALHNRVYVECEAQLDLLLPPGWELLKSKTAGQVGYHLLSYSPGSDDTVVNSSGEPPGD